MSEQHLLETLIKLLNEGRQNKIDLSDPESFYEKFETILGSLESVNVKYKQTIEKFEKNKVTENNYYLLIEELKDENMIFKQILYKLVEIHKLCAEIEGKEDIIKEQDNWLKQLDLILK